MIFSVQRFLEDYFGRRGLHDLDQYAVSLANLYDQERGGKSQNSFLQSVHRLRTVFYRNNHQLNRIGFEKSIVALLDDRFKKKASTQVEYFPGGVSKERKQFEKKARRNIATLLNGFKRAVEARAVDSFWISRKARKLQARPEHIGQGLLAVFAKGVVLDSGLVQREILSGTGFVDVMVVLSRTPHLIELKIMRNRYEGATQLSTYMNTESRRVGWLVLFDARAHDRRSVIIPERVSVKHGVINNVVVDLNPIAPSRAQA